jgi:Class III cytochrome C family/Ferric reductase like transmembrane component
MNRNLPPSYLRRTGIACAFAAALLLSPLPASAGFIWDLAAGVGYGSLVFAVALYLYPLRGEGIPHRRLFTVSQHRRIGWIALILALLHAAILLAAQPLTGHYLLPSTPLYMLCGIAALIALAVLVATGLSARSKLRRGATAGASSPGVVAHAVLAALLLGLLGAHIVGSGQLIDRPIKSVTSSVLLALALLCTAWRPLSAHIRARLPWTLVASCLTVAALALLPTPIGGMRLLQPALTPSPLHAFFPHEHHRSVDCVACHHNFIDKTGAGNCYDCHRSNRPDLHQASEATFHEFCRGCHLQFAQERSKKHGPVRECSGCHTEQAPAAALSDNVAICQTCGNANPGSNPSEAAEQGSRLFVAADEWGFR